MRILFIHQNFPGQFQYLAQALTARGHEVRALIPAGNNRPSPVPFVKYGRAEREFPARDYGLGADFAEKAWRGEAAANAARQIRDQHNYNPDIIFGHVGWGETMFLAEVWPAARRIGYAEFYYDSHNSDVDFDPEFRSDSFAGALWVRARQVAQLYGLHDVQAAVTPTKFQASRFPPSIQERITVLHEGVDTERLKPDAAASVTFPGVDHVFKAGDEVLSFVNRNLEPYRGYHIFMRALPGILAARPDAHVVIVGGDSSSYGPKPRSGSWKQIFLDEVSGRLDLSRVHFTGQIPVPEYVKLMQVARVHAYLTYPFVLSWSMLEAMSAGALVVGSRTAPVEEVIRHGENGLLVDFFDIGKWTETIVEALAEPGKFDPVREAARRTILENFDLKRICLPRLIDFVEAQGRAGA